MTPSPAARLSAAEAEIRRLRTLARGLAEHVEVQRAELADALSRLRRVEQMFAGLPSLLPAGECVMDCAHPALSEQHAPELRVGAHPGVHDSRESLTNMLHSSSSTYAG